MLLDWINDVLADDRIIVKDIEEDLFDGQILQKLIGMQLWNNCIFVYPFLAHLGRRLEWAIVIAHRPSSVRLSVRRCPSVWRKLFTFLTSSPELLDGYLWNLVGMKYLWSLPSVVVFGQIRPGADPGRGKNRSRGVPFFKKLLLQTGRLQRQTK